MEAGMDAQRRSVVLLKNESAGETPILPLKTGMKIYAENIDPDQISQYGTITEKPEEADVAIIRIKAPGEHLKGTGPIGRFFNQGSLEFEEKEKSAILKTLQKVPSVMDIYLDRPAVVPEIAAASKALLANFGACDEALLDIIFGKVSPSGKLPFEMPSSMEAVRNQKEDVPYDSENPLFRFGSGITY